MEFLRLRKVRFGVSPNLKNKLILCVPSPSPLPPPSPPSGTLSKKTQQIGARYTNSCSNVTYNSQSILVPHSAWLEAPVECLELWTSVSGRRDEGRWFLYWSNSRVKKLLNYVASTVRVAMYYITWNIEPGRRAMSDDWKKFATFCAELYLMSCRWTFAFELSSSFAHWAAAFQA